MKIGVLTGGGDCPGLNAVIRAVVKTAINEYQMEVIGIRDGFSGLVTENLIPLDINAVAGILPKGGTILGTSNRDNPFHYPVKVNGVTEYADKSAQVLEVIEKHRISTLIVIGGDGTLAISRDLMELGVDVVGVPKTIDNDLGATDYTFGFDTAVTTATEAIDKLHTTAESHHRVMIVEVMGRNAGWIALYAGVAGGADVILMPEIPFDLEAICTKIRDRHERGRRFSIVVVGEGAIPAGGQAIVAGVNQGNLRDPFKLGGIGEWLREKLSLCTDKETRVTVLGHIQRGGSPTAFDRILATRYGTEAVKAVARKEIGTVVALRGQDIVTVPLNDAIKNIKKVPVDSDLVQAAKSMGICFGD